MDYSLAQQLPIDILHRVTQELVNSALVQEQEPIDAWALLGTCRLWRMAALPVYSRCMIVCTPGDRGHNYQTRRGLSSAKVATLGWLPFVRRVVAFVSLQEYLAGGFQLALAKLGNSTSSVVCARLYVLNYAQQASTRHEKQVASRIDFSSLIIEISNFCSLYKIDITPRNIGLFSDCQDGSASIQEHARRAYTIATSARLCGCHKFQFLRVPFTGLANLVLEISGNSANVSFAIARAHAPVLENLEIKYARIRERLGLIQENGGNAITYPRLKRLSLQVLGAYTGSAARQRSALLGVPFPSLEHLGCGDVYPFANDVLLRGSRATLRKLVLAVDTSVAGWILAKKFDGMCNSTYLSHFKRLHSMKL